MASPNTLRNKHYETALNPPAVWRYLAAWSQDARRNLSQQIRPVSKKFARRSRSYGKQTFCETCPRLANPARVGVRFHNVCSVRHGNARPAFACKRGAGFTLIEILIAMAIMSLVFGLGGVAGFDFYKRYAFQTEKNTIVSVLQKARSQSLNNINQRRHGVRFADPLQYIIFECQATVPQCVNYNQADTAKDILISPAYGISITNTPFDIIFEQLSGASMNTAITVSDGVMSYNISVNSAGQIDW